MTKYILHGGKSRVENHDNRPFIQEIIKGLKSPVKLLMVYFAREEKEWPRLFKRDTEEFLSVSGEDNIQCVLADKDINILIQQINNADAIYICGGKTKGLKICLSKIKDLSDIIVGKVIAGSSAGVHVFCKYYYNKGEDKVNHGLGILPIKVLCHYDENKITNLTYLQQYGEELETFIIREGQFIVLSL